MGVGYKKKLRGVASRKRASFIFVSAEGKNKTETNYLRGFSNRNFVFRFVSSGKTDPVKMSQELIRKMEADGFDRQSGDLAYCLIDGDNASYKNKQIKQADAVAKKHGFQVILSNPCFEVWFLCHFSGSTKQFNNSDEVIDELKKYLPDYSKSLGNMKTNLSGKISTAINNAKSLREWNLNLHRKEHTVEFQPSTEVYIIVEELLKSAKCE